MFIYKNQLPRCRLAFPFSPGSTRRSGVSRFPREVVRQTSNSSRWRGWSAWLRARLRSRGRSGPGPSRTSSRPPSTVAIHPVCTVGPLIERWIVHIIHVIGIIGGIGAHRDSCGNDIIGQDKSPTERQPSRCACKKVRGVWAGKGAAKAADDNDNYQTKASVKKSFHQTKTVGKMVIRSVACTWFTFPSIPPSYTVLITHLSNPQLKSP